ncbi:hypothetical protein [Candidatus Viridilinea mediisalina]|nr:hypothetical protein [Candidatus Viridilinea mediisalina]
MRVEADVQGKPMRFFTIANPIYREIVPRELTYSAQLTREDLDAGRTGSR